MRRLSLPSHNQSLSRLRNISLDLTQLIKKQYPTKIPIAFVTSISKVYSKNKPTTKQSKIIKRFSQTQTLLNTARFVQYISSQNQYEKGKITDQNVKRIYQSSSNNQGKLTVQCLLKMAEQCDFKMDQKTATAIIKKYGKRKDFMNAEDCIKVIKRRNTKSGIKIQSQQSPRARRL